MTIYQKSQDVVSRQILDESILVPIRHTQADLDTILTLNETAALAWNLLDQTSSFDEICQEIARQYTVDLPTAQADVQELFDQLIEMGVLHKKEGD